MSKNDYSVFRIVHHVDNKGALANHDDNVNENVSRQKV